MHSGAARARPILREVDSYTQPSMPAVDTPPRPQALFEAVGRDKNGYFTRADALAVLDQYIAER